MYVLDLKGAISQMELEEDVGCDPYSFLEPNDDREKFDLFFRIMSAKSAKEVEDIEILDILDMLDHLRFADYFSTDRSILHSADDICKNYKSILKRRIL